MQRMRRDATSRAVRFGSLSSTTYDMERPAVDVLGGLSDRAQVRLYADALVTWLGLADNPYPELQPILGDLIDYAGDVVDGYTPPVLGNSKPARGGSLTARDARPGSVNPAGIYPSPTMSDEAALGLWSAAYRVAGGVALQQRAELHELLARVATVIGKRFARGAEVDDHAAALVPRWVAAAKLAVADGHVSQQKLDDLEALRKWTEGEGPTPSVSLPGEWE